MNKLKELQKMKFDFSTKSANRLYDFGKEKYLVKEISKEPEMVELFKRLSDK